MKFKKAIKKRTLKLCEEKNILFSEYTMSNLFHGDIGILKINRICELLHISKKEFFDDDLFRK